MKRIFILLFVASFAIPLLGQKTYEEFEEEWRNNPLRFLIAETRQTTVWIDAGVGNPKQSDKDPIVGKVIIGTKHNADISIISEDGSVFHTHKPKINSNGLVGDITKGKDDIGEYVDIKFDYEMFFSDFGKKEEYYGPTQLIYRLYTSHVFIIFENSKGKLGNNIEITIHTNYIGTYNIDQAKEIMKSAV
jgi:hypothetical protein